jgi:transcriptional regulator with XRE-family HTH domain
MAMKVSREEFLGVDELDSPSGDVMSAQMVLGFEASVFRVMEDQGITQKELAERLGVTPATVSKTLSKTSNMTFETAANIAHALGCVIDAPSIRASGAKEHNAEAAVPKTAADVSIVGKEHGCTSAPQTTKIERSTPRLETKQGSDAQCWGTAAWVGVFGFHLFGFLAFHFWRRF